MATIIPMPRRRTLHAVPAGDEDEPTVICAPPWMPANVEVDPEATVITSAPSPPPAPPLESLFAEPPRPPPAPAPAATPRRRWTRRRRLLLLAAVLAGGWLTMGAPRSRAPRAPSNAVLAVRQAAGAPAPIPLVPASAAIAAAVAPRPAQAASPLLEGRHAEALPHYLRLAAEHPGDEAYRTVVEILVRELDERCRAERSPTCVPAPSLP